VDGYGHTALANPDFVLVHLPERAVVLRRMVAALRPGGWLAIDDFDLDLIPDRVHGACAEADLANKVTAAFHALLASRGVDTAVQRQGLRAMRTSRMIAWSTRCLKLRYGPSLMT
jgi:trans-aconitate methyltransferase